MNKIEILAPAGAFPSLTAAVACGANAVYLGTKFLNARKNANNFDDTELEQAVLYAHARNVKIYVTLNTLLFDEELDDAIRVIKTSARLGVDALIIQDMGIYNIVKQLAPDMPLHASTQMAIHNLEGALEAQKLGFKRVVLARELTKAEIANITKNTSLEVEVFVHGALCMSVSGQCYLSSMIGERSGNRGLCAQPCRMPFMANDGIEYGLSLKDLTLIDRVEELIDIGVYSLKIEGRMKRPEYVAAAVTAVKNAISGDYVDFEVLRSVFSRSGFTKGYFENVIDSNMFGTRLREDVVSAGGVLGELERLYAHETPLVKLNCEFILQKDIPAVLRCTDENGNTAEAIGDIPEIALNKPTDEEKVLQSLGKTGGTPYYLGDVKCTIDEGLILPVSKMNLMRRSVLDEISEKRNKIVPIPCGDDISNRNKPKTLNIKKPTLRVRLRSATQLCSYMEEVCQYITMPLDELISAVENNMIKDTSKLIAEIPTIIFDDTDSVRQKLTKIQNMGIDKAWVGNFGAIEIASELGFYMYGGYSLNIINSYALEQYSKLGLVDTEISLETNLLKAKRFADYLPYGILAYGYLPMMSLRNCPIKSAIGCKSCGNSFKTLTDRKSIKFMVDCGSGIPQLFNSVPVFLADRLDELNCLDFISLYFTCENSYECERIVTQYVMGGMRDDDKTRGLYYRNVQ